MRAHPGAPRVAMGIGVKVGPPTITISHGSTFMVTDQQGHIDPQSEQGLFWRDTRVLSLYRLYVNSEPWQLLNASAVSYYAARFYFTNPPIETDRGPIPGGTIGLTVTRTVHGGIHEDFDLTSYGLEPVHFVLETASRSDFADLFEVKSRRIVRRGQRFTEWDPAAGELRTAYVNEDFRRQYAYRVAHGDSPPRHANGRVAFDVSLPPGASWHTCVYHVPMADGVRAEPLHECGAVDGSVTTLDELQEAWLESATRLISPNEDVNRVFARSVVDMAALRLPDYVPDPDLWMPAAGVPWFVTLFGRDSLIVSLQTMMVHAKFALGALHTLAQHQADVVDDWRDAEPGKILHELRFGELAHFQRIPHPYYGTADATILYLVTLHEAWKWVGHRHLIETHRDTALRCLEWIDRYGDLDGDGFQEYRTRSPIGFENQGWKDAHDAVVDADGGQVPQPKALCELQGYVFDAKLRMAEVFEALGDSGRAHVLRKEAVDLQERFDAAFWMDDEGCVAYGLGPDKRQIRSIASNAGHCLWSGIVKPERASRLVRRLLADDMWSGWGIRTLSTRNPAYNPFSYQLGSVWPHDNALIALGFARYGFVREASLVAAAIFEAANYFEHYRLPELYAGLARAPGGFPVQYLGANIPQAWAAGAVFHLLQAMLGLEADAPAGKLYVRPSLPDWLPSIELVNLEVGDSLLHLRFRAPSGVDVLARRGAIEVVELPPPR
jgi:glycogen debranching enzyme